jgi:hypothetical protein
MPDIERLQSELEVFELMTAGFTGAIVRQARLIPPDKWNWSFSERTPTAREICEHTFVWLYCDRQQMTVLDRSQHRPTPDLPADREAMLQLLASEGEEWRRLVRSLTLEQLLDERESWDGEMRNLRAFLFHIGQQAVYKNGQINMLVYELGLDGGEPYDAPFPNRYYDFHDAPVWPSPRN